MNEQIRSPRNKNFKAHLRLVDVSRDFKVLDIIFRAWFHKNCLPDSARAAIPTPLFSDRLIVIAHRILHAKHDRAASCTTGLALERVSDIEFEWSESFLICANIPPIAPRLRKEIGRADGKNDASAAPCFFFRYPDRTTVPTHLVTRRTAVIGAINVQRIPINARRKKIVVARGVG